MRNSIIVFGLLFLMCTPAFAQADTETVEFSENGASRRIQLPALPNAHWQIVYDKPSKHVPFRLKHPVAYRRMTNARHFTVKWVVPAINVASGGLAIARFI